MGKKIKDYDAYTAAMERRRFGQKEMTRRSVEGRKRAAEGKPKTWEHGKPFAALRKAVQLRDEGSEEEKKRANRGIAGILRARSAAQKRRAAQAAGLKV
jgi:hypothetical protein